MNRRRKPFNLVRVVILAVLVLAAIYINQVVVPTIPPPFVPTPTSTRDPESYVSEAQSLFDEGKISQSIESYQQAVRARPDDPAIYIAMARAQVFSGRYEDARISAENAILLNPNNSMAHALRGWALYFQGDYLASEAAIKTAIEKDPNNAAAHAYYAELLADMYASGQGPLDVVDRMSAESQTALSLAPNSLEAHRARGYVLEVTGNNEDAVREYQAAININDNIADLHLAIGRVYRTMAIYDKAVESFTRANTLNPSDPTPDLLISRTYATVGEFTKAVQFAQQAVADAPTDAFLHGNLGVMYYRNAQYSDSVTELAYVVNGGTTEDGKQVASLKLAASGRVLEYYYVYGLALVRLTPPRCNDAIPVAQSIINVASNDETALFNAQEMLRLCAESLGTPSAVPAVESSPTP